MIKDNVRKIAFVLLGFISILLVFLAYWQVVVREELVGNPYNRRLQLYNQVTRRGELRDTRGKVLAYSVQQGEQWKRVFPLGKAMAPITGYNSYKMGKTGLEEAFDPYLMGITGGQELRNKLLRLAGQQPQGLHIGLTIDSKLQELGYRLMQGRRGAIVVLEPTTGKVRALVSTPTYDPNQLEGMWEQLIADKDNTPLLNRATQGLYPPGSTLKVATGAIALAKFPQVLQEDFQCIGYIKAGGYKLNDTGVHGTVDFNQAMAVSCNTTFAGFALKTGYQDWYQGITKLGLFQKVPFDLPTTVSTFPVTKLKDKALLAQTAIGQGPMLETPLHMALLAAGVANGGKVMKPLLLDKIITMEGQIVQTGKPEVWLTDMEPEIAEKLKTALVDVVRVGTGKQAAISGLQVAGKTGSAENPHGASHAWFIGFAPAAQPRLAIAVLVENGGAGGQTAAPIAREILAEALSEAR